MKKVDRRIQRTHERLTRALIRLTLEKGYEAVSIRDITEQANVGYATFFRHYRDKDALLAEVLDTLIADLKELLQPGLQGDGEAEGELIFEHVDANSTLYRVLISSQSTYPVLERIQSLSEQEVVTQLAQVRADTVPLEVAAHHMVSAIIALISWWLDHDKPYSPARMGQIYSQLIVQPVVALIHPPE